MGRAPCCDKNGLKKGPWTSEEDLKLINYIQTHASGNWRQLPKNAGLQRCGKSCRLRWTNYLRPDIKRGRFSFEEEETIIQLHSILGNKWSAIAARLPGRTDNEIKNYWNTHIRKRLLRNGIDPVTHSPRLDFLDLSSILSSAVYSQSLLQVSNFLQQAGTQTAGGLIINNNPDVLRLATALMTLKQDNPEMLLQYLQNNHQLPVLPPNNNYNYNYNMNSTISQSTANLDHSVLNQVPQPQFQGVPTSTATSSPHHQDQASPAALINMEVQTSTHDDHQNDLGTYCSGFGGSDPSYLNCGEFSPTTQLMSSLLSSGSTRMGFDSVISTPAPSSPPTTLNSSSTFVNSSSTEDERESYSSSLLKFDIPDHGLDISDFL